MVLVAETCITAALALAGPEQASAPAAEAGPSIAVVAAAVSPLDAAGVPVAGCTSWTVVEEYIVSYLTTNIVTVGQVARWTATSTVTKEAALALWRRASMWRANEQRDWKGVGSKEGRLDAFMLKLRTLWSKMNP